ncbi:transcriptional regulator [Malikia spinosa]|uniref:Transcriptional regulator n=1 Tax=Malikia spinosa TaxID=86180 RepID=A0A2S9KAQ7_9BURK|nr:ImmA/IrrE family metallo-endopeptidase [Malikia spinosa]PRD67504.1 transcriptional regulator [Malikia spinosa]
MNTKIKNILPIDVSNNVMFVRSQSQLAKDNPAATGHRLTRFQAEEAFGRDLVQQVMDEDVVSLIPSFHEPAKTIQTKREQLGLEINQLAKFLHINSEIIRDAETPGKITPIQTLNNLCQVLALDETVLGYRPAAGSDETLGVRLRTLSEARDARSFSSNTVMALAEAAWIISKQMTLSELIGMPMHNLVTPSSRRNGDYLYPAYEKGYFLAEETRRLLGMDPDAPINSMRALIEEELNIPLIQITLDPRFAGATIANGTYRGIIVNERGKNSDVAIRRMTICHELAHLLWDPDERLNKVIVDDYTEIDSGAFPPKDPVEMRANAFAVAFLAPRSAVKSIVKQSNNLSDAITEVSHRFGISISAARHHVHNVTRIETQSIRVNDVDFEEWIPAENKTIDYLPGLDESIPISRKGMFAGIVAKAYLNGQISADTGSMCLKTSSIKFANSAKSISEMWNFSSD